MVIKCAHHVDDDSIITVDVRAINFKEARRISELVMSNSTTVELEVLFPKLTNPLCPTNHPHEALQLQEYESMKCALSGVDMFKTIIRFSDGMVAYVCLWRFHLSFEGTGGKVDPRRFAKLIASNGGFSQRRNFLGYI